MSNVAFAGYPSAVIFDRSGEKLVAVNHLLWGDHVRKLGETDGDWVKVRSRGSEGWVKADQLQDERLLEVNFVDIGQGDGCFVVTPDDEFLLVDAGQEDNMYRFLRWRFNLRNHPQQEVPIKAAILSHSDQDHYKGFSYLFRDPQFRFGTVYHNGLIERAGDDLLGPRDASGKFLTNVVSNLDELRLILDDPAKVTGKQYPKMLKGALDSGRCRDIRILCSEDGFMPGYEEGKELSMRVLAPVPEGNPRKMRWFKDNGKTKNGHSVVVKLRYRNVRMLLGGDLNTFSEDYLLEHYAGDDEAKAREVFEVDVAKACHHGSGDFRESFLKAMNAVVTIISSGDAEPHAHPRPDTLGALGKHGRGTRPLIFSTELARSAKDSIPHPNELKAKIAAASEEASSAETDEARQKAEAKLIKALEAIERTVTVYGMINVRTDGKKVIVAQKLETPRAADSKWDIHRLEPNGNGELEYFRKEREH